VTVEKRNSDILNRLRKTKEEREPDLQEERDAYLAAVARERRKQKKEEQARERAAREEQQRLAEARSYDRVFLAASESMVSNQSAQDLEDDFM